MSHSQTFNEIKRFIRVGLFSFIVDIFIYYMLQFFFNFDSSTSKIISFIFGTTSSYFLNKNYTFKIIKVNKYQITLFFGIYLFSVYLNSEIHDYFIEFTSGFFAVFCASLISAIFNFISQKTIIFRKKN